MHLFLSPQRYGFPWWFSGEESTCNAEAWTRSLNWGDTLEKEMATHFCIPALEIPWTEEPVG